MARPRLAPAALLAALALAGCADGKKVVPTTGVATRAGKPVPRVIVQFVPAAGRPSYGEADQEGRFELVYDPEHKGAEVGPHKVHVAFPTTSPQEETDIAAGKRKRAPDQKAILDKYGDAAKPAISVEVKGDGVPIEIKLD